MGVPGDSDPEKILHSFKSYASRALNRQWGKPVNGTWWVESGSKRKVAGHEGLVNVLAYVRDQEYPLLVWLSEEAQRILASAAGERGADIVGVTFSCKQTGERATRCRQHTGIGTGSGRPRAGDPRQGVQDCPPVHRPPADLTKATAANPADKQIPLQFRCWAV